jgi:hypothetical protein
MKNIFLSLCLVGTACSATPKQLVYTPEPVPFSNELCPVTGEPIDTTIEPMALGPVKLGFHSRNCKIKFGKMSAAEQRQKLSAVLK